MRHKENLSNQRDSTHMTNVGIDFRSHFLQTEKQLSATTYDKDSDPRNDMRDIFYSLI